MEGLSRVTRGRRLHDLEDSETELELRRFLDHGHDFDDDEDAEDEEEAEDEKYRPFRLDQAETFGNLGQFWLSKN
jgi:hypothetical protein